MKTDQLIPTKEREVITQIVEIFAHDDLRGLMAHLLRIFGKNISTAHYIEMGRAIGTREATANSAQKQTNLYTYGKGHN